MFLKTNLNKISVTFGGLLVQMSGLLSGIFTIPFLQTFSWLPIVIVGLIVFFKEETSRPLPGYLSLLLFFFLWLFAGILYSNAPNYAIWKVCMFSLYWIAIGFCVFKVGLVPGLANSFFLGIVIGTAVSMLIVFFELGNPLQIISQIRRFDRFSLGESNPIMFSQYLGMSVIIITGFLLGKRTFEWLPVLGALFLTIFLLSFMFLTGSKGPLLALTFGVSTLSLFSNFKRHIGVVVIFLASLALTINYLLPYLSKEFISHRYSIVGSGSVDSRISTISDAVLTSSSIGPIIFGKGTGNFGFFYSNVDHRMYPHNIMAEVIYENGIIGIALLLFILIYPLLCVFKCIRKHQLNILPNSGNSISIAMAIYIYSVINAQISGDIASNFNIGLFGWLTLASVQLTKPQTRKNNCRLKFRACSQGQRNLR